MNSKNLHTRILAFILSLVMLLSVGSLVAFAEDYSFTYYFANEEMTEVYITGFKGEIPTNGCVVIPDSLNNYSVVGIAEYAFRDMTELKSVIVPDNIEYVDENAFFGCGQIELIYRSNYDKGDFDNSDVFEDHKQDYIISGSTLVGYKGSDTIISVPYNCDAIADGAFKNNKNITAVYIQKELKTIGESAFEGCSNLETVVAGDGCGTLTIGSNAFKGTAWLNNYSGAYVVLGTTLVKYKGSSETVTIPNVLTSVASGAFSVDETGNAIAYKVKVPVSVENFAEDCFFLYDSVTKVYPELLVYKDSAAESYCYKNGLKYTISALPGDTDGDGRVTASDARYVLRVAAKLEKPVSDIDIKSVADVTGDNKIAADDARLILRIAAKLDNYSAQELLAMPRTDYELLLYASNAISLAKDYGCSYSKFAYQEITQKDMNLNSKTYFGKFEDELTPAKKAVTTTYEKDTPEALANLFDITLVDYEKIQSYNCTIKDGYYNISLTLEPETVTMENADEDTFTQKMFPVTKASYYADSIKNAYWGSKVNGNMTYRDCTLEMKVAINSGMIMDMTVTMNYDFEIWGKIMGIGIKGDNGNATATRQDVIKYSNFSYFEL